MKIAFGAVVVIVFLVHLFIRDYPFGGALQTIFDVLVISLLAVVAAMALGHLAYRVTKKEKPPIRKDENPEDFKGSQQ
ncbi:hypothetical protein [Alkalicoccus halolimnae]|uniref:Uncharacterized protein n=1 Tax=Alkalicoccus halolimnae TaxID=1667239 RepID=A0A5C7FLE4_9BACI|nr:hypothetical protein [Alkalicoccus halolimnae]TXF85545.1 hypothetical protein FTX54_08105 [Alkalicoccus halolimnae]